MSRPPVLERLGPRAGGGSRQAAGCLPCDLSSGEESSRCTTQHCTTANCPPYSPPSRPPWEGEGVSLFSLSLSYPTFSLYPNGRLTILYSGDFCCLRLSLSLFLSLCIGDFWSASVPWERCDALLLLRTLPGD